MGNLYLDKNAVLSVLLCHVVMVMVGSGQDRGGEESMVSNSGSLENEHVSTTPNGVIILGTTSCTCHKNLLKILVSCFMQVWYRSSHY